MDNDKDRYFDFSTDEEDVDALRSGANTPSGLKIFAGEMQRIVRIKNPVIGIRGLLALHVYSVALGDHLAIKSRSLTNSLLAIIALILAYIAYVLT